MILTILSCSKKEDAEIDISIDVFNYTDEDTRTCDDLELQGLCELTVLNDLKIHKENLSLMNFFNLNSEDEIFWTNEEGKIISSTVIRNSYRTFLIRWTFPDFLCESDTTILRQHCSKAESIYTQLIIPELNSKIEIQIETTRELRFTLEGYDLLRIWRTKTNETKRTSELSYKLPPVPEETRIAELQQEQFSSIDINSKTYFDVISYNNGKDEHFKYYLNKDDGLFAIQDTTKTTWVLMN